MAGVRYFGKLSLTTRVYGVPEFIQTTRNLREQIADGLQAAVHAGAAIFEAEAKAIVPVRTGKLRDSIHIEIAQSNSEGALAVVGPDETVDYAIPVEYGTYKMKAKPYMRPAYDNKMQEAADAVEEVLASEIREAISTPRRGIGK